MFMAMWSVYKGLRGQVLITVKEIIDNLEFRVVLLVCYLIAYMYSMYVNCSGLTQSEFDLGIFVRMTL